MPKRYWLKLEPLCSIYRPLFLFRNLFRIRLYDAWMLQNLFYKSFNKFVSMFGYSWFFLAPINLPSKQCGIVKHSKCGPKYGGPHSLDLSNKHSALFTWKLHFICFFRLRTVSEHGALCNKIIYGVCSAWCGCVSIVKVMQNFMKITKNSTKMYNNTCKTLIFQYKLYFNLNIYK